MNLPYQTYLKLALMVAAVLTAISIAAEYLINQSQGHSPIPVEKQDVSEFQNDIVRLSQPYPHARWRLARHQLNDVVLTVSLHIHYGQQIWPDLHRLDCSFVGCSAFLYLFWSFQFSKFSILLTPFWFLLRHRKHRSGS